MIWNFCIRRPVLTIVAFLIVAIFGVYGYQQMAVREFPDVEFPVVSVNVVLQGAEPEVVETEVIEPLEEELNTIEGLKELKSTSREQVGNITAEFELWRDVDVAAQDVRDRIDRARRELPDEAEAPIVRKLDPDARAIMWLAIQGNERWDKVQITEYVENVLKERIEGIRGVGRVQVGGAQRFAVRIKLDPGKLAAHRLTVQDVVTTIRQNNVDIPSGRITGEQTEFLVKTSGQFSDPEPFNRLIITERNGNPIRLSDVGQAVAGIENDRQLARFNGKPTVGLGIVKQSDANTVELAETVKKRIENLSGDFPPGLRYSISSDPSVYIQENINDLLMTIFIATFLVVIVVLFFLRVFWGTLISTIAIPTSLMAGFALIYVFDFSLNVLTMLGLILVIGIVVDDAIVVMESCYRHLEKGAGSMAAARVGTTEIAFAAIANTLSLAAVFIPVAFTRGMIGRFFFEFGVTVAVTVFASTITALTLTPLMSSRLLSVPERRGWFWEFSENVFQWIEDTYGVILDWSLEHRTVVVVVAVIAIGLGGFFFSQISKEFAPKVDKGEFMVSFETPEGTTLKTTNQYAKKIEDVLQEVPEVDRFFLAIGLSQGGGPGKVNEGISFVRLTHRTERQRSQQQIMQAVREKLANIPDGNAYVLEPGGPGGQRQSPASIILKHPRLEKLASRQKSIKSWMRKQEEFVGVNSDLKMNKPQVYVNINRERAREQGIDVARISNTMRFLMGEPDISEIERGNERYQVISQLRNKRGRVPEVLKQLYLRNDQGGLVTMGNLVTLEEQAGPSAINHYNRQRSVTIGASTPPGVVLGEAMNKLRSHLDRTLPSSYDWKLAGKAQDMQEAFYNLTISLVFAVVFIYLVLAAQFESWLHPFTILTTLPLAGVGAYGILYAFDMTFNVFSFIGTIMLLGLVTKNGILLVDYTNVLIARDKSLKGAVAEAGRVRMRPVLMTAFSTILGMMPIAFGYGAGGRARAPMGWSVAGGMLTATVLTLVVIPVVYTLIDEVVRWIKTHPWAFVRRIMAILIAVGAGGVAWLPFQYGWTGFYFTGSLFDAFLFGMIAWGVWNRQIWSRYAVLVLSGIGFVKGIVLWVGIPVIESLVPAGIDPVTTGQLSLVASALFIIVFNLPGLAREMEQES
ncbi:MAG: efflux RND transporter permease subunit [bacterium]